WIAQEPTARWPSVVMPRHAVGVGPATVQRRDGDAREVETVLARFRGSAQPNRQAAVPDVRTLPEPAERLGELLVRREAMSHGQLADALLQRAASGMRIGSLVVEVGALSESALASALAEQFHLELVDRRRDIPDDEAVALLPEPAARRLTAIPLRVDGDALV